MAPRLQAFILLLPFLLSSTMAFNITAILEPFPEFSTFNNYLNQTKLVDEINHRQTITVLAVENSKLSTISSLPFKSLKDVMQVHVVLDYYDIRKIKNINRKSFLLTTLFQTSGVASNRTGFLNVTHEDGESVVFGSAARGAPRTSTLIKKVTTMPYNISVLQISDPIIPPGVEGAPSIAPVLALPRTSTDDPSTTEAPEMADAPTESSEESVDPPADAPAEESADVPAEAPEADGLISDAPEASSTSAKKASDVPASGSSRRWVLSIGLSLGLVIGVVFLISAF